ncbi:MAG: glycosyltransferase family 2 protein, partial [Proteobacteria bacterium]
MQLSPSPVEILVVVPAHNEEETIGKTIESIQKAGLKTFGDLSSICVIVVCDSCTDSTEVVAKDRLSGTTSLVTSVSFRNVGMSRDHGVKLGLALHPHAFWIAFTDADTLV